MRGLLAIGTAIAIATTTAAASAALSAAVSAGPPDDGPDRVVGPAEVEVSYLIGGVPDGFHAIATRETPNGVDLDGSTVDTVLLSDDGRVVRLPHVDGVCSAHVATEVVEDDARVHIVLAYESDAPADEVTSTEEADGSVTVQGLVPCPSVGIHHVSSVTLAAPLGLRDLVVTESRAVAEP